jgi:outer membrane protein OmpA-like peptidoglycan-associated protein
LQVEILGKLLFKFLKIMNKSTFAKSLLIIALAVLPLTFFGQNDQANENQKKEKTSYWYVGFNEGATLLFGDNKTWDFENVRPELDVNGGFVFAKHFAVYGRIGAGTLRGKLNNVFKVENASFIAYDLNLSVDLVSLIWGYNPDRVFGLKPHAGFGQMQYQARTILANGQVLKFGYDDATTTSKGNGIGGRKVVWEVPMGIECEFNLNRRVALLLDVMTTYTDTDGLEAYVGGKHYDWFSAVNVGFRYKFRPKKETPCVPDETELNECREALQQAQEALEQCQKDKEAAEKAMQEAQAAAAAAEAEKAASKAEVEYEAKDMHLTFAMGKAVVENTPANKAELKKITDDMENGREIDEIKVVGHASPEGNAAYNQKLSKDRADATAKFIKDGMGEKANDINFVTEGKGADWDGFIAEIQNSDMADKDQIINELQNSDDKVAALKKISAKHPEIKKFYPELRQTEILIK